MMKEKDRVKIVDFQVVHFRDDLHKEIILIYGLGDDGIVYELNGGRWFGFPVQADFMRPPPNAKPPGNP